MTNAISNTAQLPMRLFRLLADGEFHSGEDLAHRLGLSRSAVWKAANALREAGANLEAIRNRGYKLARATDALDAPRIRAQISREIQARLKSLEVAWCIDSTNAALLARENPPPGMSEALLVEIQTAGRGRRGRSWLGSLGGGIYLSLSWTFAQVPRDVGSLSLAVGVCVRRALEALGARDVQLKWPNDLLHRDRKLGGILIELRAEAAGPACAVIGIGLNVALAEAIRERIAESGLSATDLLATGMTKLSRNAIAAEIIASCITGLTEFEREGLRPFMTDWTAADALQGRAVAVQALEGEAKGIARGIDLSGALLVETPQGLQKFHSGEVSVRATV